MQWYMLGMNVELKNLKLGVIFARWKGSFKKKVVYIVGLVKFVYLCPVSLSTSR